MIQPSNLIFQLKDVVKTYTTSSESFNALNKVNIDIRQGEFLGITGKSGAGKTTLLNMISGVSELTSGSILFHYSRPGVETPTLHIHTLNEDKLARWRGENLGVIFQSFELMPTLTLLENVMLPPDFLGGYQPALTRNKAMNLLELVEIAEHANKIPAHISGGQKQRVAIARALVNDPNLILADEPTGNLDSVTADTIIRLFEKLVSQGKTIVMVTHDEGFSQRFSRRLRIIDGEIQDPNNLNVRPLPTDSQHHHRQHFLSKGIEDARQGTDTPAIVLRGVDKIYDGASGKFHALKTIDLRLNYGQFISIVGKSGCGKSTLLNMITGIDHPTRGEVLIGGEDIYKMSESQRALWRGRNLGVVFQFFQLLPTLTLLENTMLPMDYCGTYPFPDRPAKAMELLKLVGLEEMAHKLPTAVSSGQQQQAAIARALATDPNILLADEPTGNLDSRAAENILNLFEDLADRGKTVLIVTHDPSITQRTDQTIILSDGEIIDEAVARALPYLSHPLMLAATKQAEKISKPANSPILHLGGQVDSFYMITSGSVNIILDDPTTGLATIDAPLATLVPGQFFGEVELTRGGSAIAHVHAGDNGVELAVIPGDLFLELIEGSPLTRSEIDHLVNSRLDENRQKQAEE